MLMRLVGLIIALVFVGFATGCLPERERPAAAASSAPSWFDGVANVTNLGGLPATIRISWSRPINEISAFRIYVLKGGTDGAWEVLSEVNADTTTYLHSDLDSGKVYTYKVKAVDVSGNEDSNTVQMSSLAFEGISTVRVLSQESVQVGLSSPTGSFDEIRVYAQPKRAGGAKTLVATSRSKVDSLTITGLRSGMSYKFFVNAYMRYLDKEDGNEVSLDAQTPSMSYGSGDSTDTSYQYQGVLNVQAYGKADNAPVDPSDSTRIPKTRKVRVTWLPFKGASSQTKYRLVRAPGGTSIDTTTAKLCSTDPETSCQVCDAVGSGSKSCWDTNVAAPPKRYDYTVVLVRKDPVTSVEWVEELPKTNSTDFVFSVHIPPDYMVLVQRDAANYEMCYTLRKTSDPRKKQRCAYSGLGATTYSSGPGKPALGLTSTYYDVGYNFFVDRYQVACNFTRGAAAKCGAGRLTKDCFGETVPDNMVGVDGNVYYLSQQNGVYPTQQSCWIFTSGSWKNLDSTSLDPSDRIKAMTIDPLEQGGHRPPMFFQSQSAAYSQCQSVTTPYGSKRLPRLREYLVASPLPYIDGEPDAFTSPNLRMRMEDGKDGQGAGFYQCANDYTVMEPVRDVADYLTAANVRTNYKVGATTYGYRSHYFIGLLQTSRCVSRFGAQDMITGYNTTSDRIVRTNAVFPSTWRGTVSPFDAGNNDLDGFEFSDSRGPAFPSGDLVFNWTTATTAFTNIAVPLALPIKVKSNALEDVMEIRDFVAYGNEKVSPYNAYTFRFKTSSAGGAAYVGLGGRWNVYWETDAKWVSNFRCAVEAE